MSSQSSLAPRLNCEQLESRENPSGNVAVGLANGVIYVAGDAYDNAISIQMNQYGDVYVYGMNYTTVNGLSAIYVGRGIPNGLAVDMGAGDDYVSVLGVATYGSINVTGNYGNDNIYMSHLFADGQVVLDGGLGIDASHADNVIAYGGGYVLNSEYPY